MSFILNYLRRVLRRPPVIAFIALALGSCLVGYTILYLELAQHQSSSRVGYLQFETDNIKVEFPKSWFAYEVKNENASGVFYRVGVIGPTGEAYLAVQDEKATDFIMNRFNLTSITSLIVYMVNDTFTAILSKNPQATLDFGENSTMSVLSLDAQYSKVSIRGVPDSKGALHNVTYMVIAGLKQGRLVYVLFLSEEDKWDEGYQTFVIILSSIDLRRWNDETSGV